MRRFAILFVVILVALFAFELSPPGFVAIQALNIVRIASLFDLGQWSEAWFEFAHLYLWQTLIMLDALVVWLPWIRNAPAPEPAPPPAAA